VIEAKLGEFEKLVAVLKDRAASQQLVGAK
jgi:hypothetical protein